MGIKGLWKEVQPVCRASHISQFRGLRVGIDTYCWLHRAVIACSAELALGKPCDKYLTFMMNRVDLLLRYGVTPILVFDGDAMPQKRGTDADRKMRRQQAQEEGRRLMEQGAVDEATKMFEKCLDVTTEIAFSVLQVMQDRGIECIVAPYEADAQLGYLVKEGYVHAVISEDSDLIVYHCGTLLAKMDSNGSCECLHIRDLPNVPLLNQLSYESFVVGCIMSGCDYLPSLPNIGIKTALKLVGTSRSIPLLMEALRTQHHFAARELASYESGLQAAFYCFAHHLVYDPVQKQIVPFRPFPTAVAHNEELIGVRWDSELAVSVCSACTVDPITKAPYVRAHQANVEMYWRRVKSGQASLTTFSGFQGKHAARIVVGMAAALGTNASASRRLADSPPTTTSPLQDGGSDEQLPVGFLGSTVDCLTLTSCQKPLTQHPVNRTLVVSKYFHKRAGIIDDDDDDDEKSRSSVDDVIPAATHVLTRPPPHVPTSTTIPVMANIATKSAVAYPSSPAYSDATTNCSVSPRVCSPLIENPSTEDVPPQQRLVENEHERGDDRRGAPSHAASPVVPSPSVAYAAPLEHVSSSATTEGLGSLCPYGYPQCGRRHSIFLKCFEGRGWVREEASNSCGQQESQSQPHKRPRDESHTLSQPKSGVSYRSTPRPRVAELSSLRHILGEPTTRPTAPGVAPPPPALSAITDPKHNEHMSASTRAAAALFQQFAMRR